MSRKLRDLSGKVFGRLTVLRRGTDYNGNKLTDNGETLWVCKCACGKRRTVRRSNLVSGATKSCGCLRIETSTARLATMRS
jgi:hypothetical protein